MSIIGIDRLKAVPCALSYTLRNSRWIIIVDAVIMKTVESHLGVDIFNLPMRPKRNIGLLSECRVRATTSARSELYVSSSVDPLAWSHALVWLQIYLSF